MTVRLDPATISGWPKVKSLEYGHWTYGPMEDVPEDGQPWDYIFCCEELHEFCRILLEMGRHEHSIIGDTALILELNPALGNGQAAEIDSNAAGLSRMRKLLSPLRQLHSLGAAQIDGPLSANYKKDTITNVCKSCPSAMEIIESTMDILDLADQQADKGRFRYAILGYKAALGCIRACHWQWDEHYFFMDSGPFPGLQTFQVIENISIRLHARVTAVYLESGQSRMARIYTERALDPRRGYDHRFNKMHAIVVEPWEEIAYAEVLHVAAKISYTHGDVSGALCDLHAAGQFVPLNEEQESRREAWQSHADRLWARETNRWDTTREREDKRDKKAEGIIHPAELPPILAIIELICSSAEQIQVVCKRKKKGDAFIRRGHSILAASTYQTALHKLRLLTQTSKIHFKMTGNFYVGYCAFAAINSLKLKLSAGLAAASLMSRKYEDVGQLTSSVLKCSLAADDCREQRYCDCMSNLFDPERNWMDDHKLDYLKIYYCKAQSLKHSGDTKRAIQHMEKALGFDPGDGTVFTQLGLLKQQRLAEREQRAKKLNFLQNQLRKKQARRKEKARV